METVPLTVTFVTRPELLLLSFIGKWKVLRKLMGGERSNKTTGFEEILAGHGAWGAAVL